MSFLLTRIVALGIALLSLFAICPSWAAPPSATPAPTYLLRYKFTQGQVQRYRTVFKSAGTMVAVERVVPLNELITIDSTLTVQSVESDGSSADVALTVDSVAIEANGKSISLPADQVKTGNMMLTITSAGVVTPHPDGPPSRYSATINMGGSDALSETPSFGDSPAKIGDVWRSSILSGSLGIPIYYKSALIGVNSSNGTTIAKTHFKFGSDTKGLQAGSAQVAVKLDETYTGTGDVSFDIDHGEITVLTTQSLTFFNVAEDKRHNHDANPALTVDAQLRIVSRRELISDSLYGTPTGNMQPPQK